MKKILAISLLLISVAGSASAASNLATNTVTEAAGLSVFGGVDTTAAQAATTPLIKFSTGVYGLVNFVAATHDAYAIATKHQSGSKVFGTANDSTAIYWRQVPSGAPDAGSDMMGEDTASSDLFVGGGWTAY